MATDGGFDYQCHAALTRSPPGHSRTLRLVNCHFDKLRELLTSEVAWHRNEWFGIARKNKLDIESRKFGGLFPTLWGRAFRLLRWKLRALLPNSHVAGNHFDVMLGTVPTLNDTATGVRFVASISAAGLNKNCPFGKTAASSLK